jgi:hypothetical protein
VEKRISDVLDMMGLMGARDTLVGTPLIKGISGKDIERSSRGWRRLEKL